MNRERPEAGAVFEKLDEVVRRAPQIPLTDQIRIDRSEIYDRLDLLRALLADSMREDGEPTGPASAAASDVLAVLDELDLLVQKARPIPLTTQVRVDRLEIYELLDRLRAGIA